MQIALDECNANLIRLQASSVTGVEYPVHGRAPAVPGPGPAPAPEPFEVPKKAAKPTVGRKEAARAPADAAAVDEAAAPAPAPAAAPKLAAHSPIAAPEKKAVKPAVGRKEAAAAFTAALAPGLRTRAYVYNTLLADKATDDRLRKYPSWLASRNLANQASDASVQALIEAVVGQSRPPAKCTPSEGTIAGWRGRGRMRPPMRGLSGNGRGPMHRAR